MKRKKLLSLLADTIQELRSNRQWGTAHVYQSTARSFSTFLVQHGAGTDITFEQLNPALLKAYEGYLRDKGRRWNTVATYMKVLKATYNRAVDQSAAPFIPRLFKHVRTTPCNEQKRSLHAEEMHRIVRFEASREGSERPSGLLTDGCNTPHDSMRMGIETSRLYFLLMFLLRGIPFVDIAYLRRSDIRGNTLHYQRRKTGKELSVTLTPEAQALIAQLSTYTPSSPYLFPFLHSPEGSEEAYREYQNALRKFNRHLKRLSQRVGGGLPTLSSYTARHTWATLAYHCEVHPGIISEAMGHSSIAITEVYLKPFRNEKIDLANLQVIDHVMHCRC